MRHAASRRQPAPCVLLGLLFAALLSGCTFFRDAGLGGDDAQWTRLRYRNTSASTVMQLAQAVSRDRYPPAESDPEHGVLVSGWVYGLFSERTHEGLRARVISETTTEGDLIVIRLRVQRESSQTVGRGPPRAVEDWQPYDDDELEAKRLSIKLNHLMKDLGELVPDEPEDAPR